MYDKAKMKSVKTVIKNIYFVTLFQEKKKKKEKKRLYVQ